MRSRPQELKKIDTLFQKQNEQDFLSFVQSPDYTEALHIAVIHLTSNWPTIEQIEELWQFTKQRAPHAQLRAYDLLEKTLVENLRDARTLNELNTYNSEDTTPAAEARLFSELYRRRPESKVLTPSDSIEDAIFSIKKDY